MKRSIFLIISIISAYETAIQSCLFSGKRELKIPQSFAEMAKKRRSLLSRFLFVIQFKHNDSCKCANHDSL